MFAQILPASFLLTSFAYKPVRALSITWQAESPEGTLQFTIHRYSRPGQGKCVSAARAALRPGITQILAPALSLQPPRRGATRAPDWSSVQLPERAQVFLHAAQRATRMKVTIDDVLYADGTLVGTAASGLQDRLTRQWGYERAQAAALLHSPTLSQTERWRSASPFLARLAVCRDAVGQRAFERRLDRYATRPEPIRDTRHCTPFHCSWPLPARSL